MKTKQAKDFLVQQTAEQVTRENVQLSDIEKKMMYFTESDSTSCENPLELNDEFEAQYDTEAYEAKISRLLHNAYERLKVEDPERMREWKLAMRTLRKGDHYLLVLWDSSPPSEHPIRDFLKPVGVGVLIAFGIGIAIVASVEDNISWERVRKYVPAPTPRRVVFVFVGVFLLALLGFRLFNWLLVASSERGARAEIESE